jgi:hypothetical protein
MPSIKLCILITYLFLGPSAPWAHGGRPACPPSKPALGVEQDMGLGRSGGQVDGCRHGQRLFAGAGEMRLCVVRHG